MATATQEHGNKIEIHNDNQNSSNNSNQSGTQATTSMTERTPKQEVLNQPGVERTRTGKVYTPAVDIYETSDAVVLLADMPGVNDHSVDVTLEKNVLTIYGHVEPLRPEGHNLAYAEYGTGDYQRSFTISNDIDFDHIQGTVKNGVLALTLPKVGPAQTKKIPIRQA